MSFVKNLDQLRHRSKIDAVWVERQLQDERIYSVGELLWGGRSGAGNCSGGGTRRGSSELMLNVSRGEPVICATAASSVATVVAASKAGGAGLISSLETYPFSPELTS